MIRKKYIYSVIILLALCKWNAWAGLSIFPAVKTSCYFITTSTLYILYYRTDGHFSYIDFAYSSKDISYSIIIWYWIQKADHGWDLQVLKTSLIKVYCGIPKV